MARSKHRRTRQQHLFGRAVKACRGKTGVKLAHCVRRQILCHPRRLLG